MTSRYSSRTPSVETIIASTLVSGKAGTGHAFEIAGCHLVDLRWRTGGLGQFPGREVDDFLEQMAIA
jgi:hypothetical protein